MKPVSFSAIISSVAHWKAFLHLTLITLTIASVGLFLFMNAGCSIGPTETREDSFAITGQPRIVIKSENGNIEVNAGFGNEVLIEANLRDAPRVEYEVSQTGDIITIDVKVERHWWFWGMGGADITVTTPVETTLELNTSNGFIELHGIKGSGWLETSNGRLVLDDVKGDFEGRTSNGRIEVEAMEGSAFLRTSNGSVNIKTSSGEFDVQTSNGSISFGGNMTAGGSNRLVTSNGNVDVKLLGTPSVVLDAETSNGDVSSELPILATVTKKDRLVGEIGLGEADLYIRTSNGNVAIGF
jgi:DUF4097 and DUF4098 domain-containing protein YvlB